MSEINWKETTKRYVGFLDIMGFTDMIACLKHEELLQKFKMLHELVTLTANSFDRSFILAENGTSHEYKGHVSVKIVQFSDSILFIGADGTAATLFDICCAMTRLMDAGVHCGMPMKGSVAYGLVTADEKGKLVFGQPIVDSYHLQEQIHFYGAVMHHTAEKRILESLGFEENSDRNYINIGGWYWTKAFLKDKSHTFQAYHFLMVMEDSSFLQKYYNNVSGTVRMYLDNTNEILQQVKKMDTFIESVKTNKQ